MGVGGLHPGEGLHPGGLHPGGVCILRGSVSWGVCIQGGRADPPSDTIGYGQLVGCTNPTGMHSCFTLNIIIGYKLRRKL